MTYPIYVHMSLTFNVDKDVTGEDFFAGILKALKEEVTRLETAKGIDRWPCNPSHNSNGGACGPGVDILWENLRLTGQIDSV